MTDAVVNSLGRTMFVDPADRRAKGLAHARGDFNPGSLRLWNAMLALPAPGEWDLVVDVGANYGEMLAGSMRTPGRRVVAFEPSPRIAPLLRRTCADLPFDVEVEELAVSDSPADRVAFAMDTAWSGTSHLAAVDSDTVSGPDLIETVEVPVTTLDTHFPDPVDSAFLKLDVEGAEQQVLDGAASFLSRSGRVAVMAEILHLPVQGLWKLQQERPMALWCEETSAPVLVEDVTAEELGTLLHSGEYYRQDAVFLHGRDAEAWVAELRTSWGTTAERARRHRAQAAEQEAAARRQAAELTRLTAEVARLEREARIWKASRAHRLASAYGTLARRLRRR